MSDAKTDLLQGTLDLIVLRLLRAGPANGWDVTQSIQVVSKGALEINYGSVYPALRRLEAAGYVKAEWGDVGQQPASAILRADGVRAKATRGRARGVGQVRRRARPHSGCRIVASSTSRPASHRSRLRLRPRVRCGSSASADPWCRAP